MPLTRMSKVFLILATALAAYLSASTLFGYLFFGFSNFLEFRLFALPVLALPVLLVAWWRLSLGTALFFALTLTYFLTQVQVAGGSLRSIPQSHSEVSLYVVASAL